MGPSVVRFARSGAMVTLLALVALLPSCRQDRAPQPVPTAQQQAGGGPRAIFGSALIEAWDARAGTTVVDGRVTAWAGQVRGITLQPPSGTGPRLGADGSWFRGAPVIQCAGGDSLLARLGAPLIAQGARPYFAVVGRLRAVPPRPTGIDLVAFDHYAAIGDAGIHLRIDQRANWLAYYRMGGSSPMLEARAPIDTELHVFEYLLRPDTGVSMYIDGVLSASWSEWSELPLAMVRSPLQAGLDQVSFCAYGGASPAPLSLAQVVLLGEIPSAAQRAAFLASAKEDFEANYCGDGRQFGRETCDDGNTDDGDLCRNDCTAPQCGPSGAQPCKPPCPNSQCGRTALESGTARPRAAFSVADRLSSRYFGPAFRVRRADGAEANIGFGALNVVDEAQVSAFCGGSDCFLATLHDQSGNGYDLTQAVPEAQIRMYEGATRTLAKHAGKPVIPVREPRKNVRRREGLGLREDPALTVLYVGRLARGSLGSSIAPIRIGIEDRPEPPSNEIALGYAPYGEQVGFGSGVLSFNNLRSQEMHRASFIHAGGPLGAARMRVDAQDVTLANRDQVGGATFHVARGGSMMIGQHLRDPAGSEAELQTVIVWPQAVVGEDLFGVEQALSVSADRCPTDPNKTAPGSCGCGVPEANPCVVPVPDPSRVIPSTPPGGVARVPGLVPGIVATYQEPTPGDGYYSELRYAPVDGAHERPRFCDAAGNEIPAPSEAELNAPPPPGATCVASGAPGQCPIDPSSIGNVACANDTQCPTGQLCGAKCADATCLVIEHYCGRPAAGCGGLTPQGECQDYTMCAPHGAVGTEAELAARKQQHAAEFATATTRATIAAADQQPLNGFEPVDQAAICIVSDDLAQLSDMASKPSFNTPAKKWDVFFDHALDYQIKAGKNPNQITQLDLGGTARVGFGGVVWGHRFDALGASAAASLSDCHVGLTANVKIMGEAVVAISADTATGFNFAIADDGEAGTPQNLVTTCKAAKEQAKAALMEVRKANVFQRTVDAYYQEHALTPELCRTIVKMVAPKDLAKLGIPPNCDNVHNLPALEKLNLLNLWKGEYDGKAAALPSYLSAMGVAQQQIKTSGTVPLFNAALPFHYKLIDLDIPIGPISLNLAAEGYGSWSIAGGIEWGVGFNTMQSSTLAGVAEALQGGPGGIANGIADVRAFGGPVMTPAITVGVLLFVGAGVPGVSVGIEGHVNLLTSQLKVSEVVAAMRVSEDDRRDLTASQWAGQVKPGMVNRNYHWALGYHHNARLVFTELDGKVDLAARIRILFFNKTFRMNLFNWKGFEQKFDLVAGGNGDAISYAGKTGPRGEGIAYTEIAAITDANPRTAPSGPVPRACEFGPD